jgi:hypothetical protein
MAVKSTSKSKKTSSKSKKDLSMPLDNINLIIIGIGVIFLIIGYILMAENSVDGFLPTVVSPILLVLGYCVIIPYGILKKPKKVETVSTEGTENVAASQESVSSNIKTK